MNHHIRCMVGLGCLLWGLSLAASAQSKKYIKEYNIAKAQFEAQSLVRAREIFVKLAANPEGKQLAENSAFYLALTYQRNNELAEAQQAFMDFVVKYPNSSYVQEALYQASDMAFRQGQTADAIALSARITAPELRRQALAMKGHYLVKCTQAQLIELNNRLPQDTLIAQTLADKIAFSSESENDYVLLEQLLHKYALSAPTYRKLEKVIRQRATYKVALALPFEINKIRQRDTTAMSRMAWQMYAGMYLAKLELDSLPNSPKIKLLAYDVNRDNEANVLRDKLTPRELKDLDVVVGTVFESSFRRLADSTAALSLMLLHPLSTEDRLISSPYTYLYLPSIESQARQAATIAKAKFPQKSVVILYDNLAKSKSMAGAMRAAAEAQGLQVLRYELINANETDKLNKLLAGLNPTAIGSIWVSSTSQLFAQELLKRLKDRAFDVPLLVPEAWLRFQDIELAVLEQQRVHFITQGLPDTENTQALRMKRAFVTQYPAQGDPNEYAYQGYEIMHFLAHLLQEYGTKAEYARIARAPWRGIINEQIDLRGGQSNQYAPILHLVEGELKNALEQK